MLGIVAGAVAVATAAGLLPLLAGAIPVLAGLGGASLLASSPERLLGPAPLPVAEDEVREVRIRWFDRLRVTPRTVVFEKIFSTTTARIEDLAWAYGVHYASRRWIPLVADAKLVLKFCSGAEVSLPCLNSQVTPAISALRYFAGHVALGWDPELATSWETNRRDFVASVQARLGRVSGETP